MKSFQDDLDQLQGVVASEYQSGKFIEYDLNSDEEKEREKIFTPEMNEFRRVLGIKWFRAWTDAEASKEFQDPQRRLNLYSITDDALEMEDGYSVADLKKILSPYVMQIRQIAIDNRKLKDENWIRKNDAIRLARYGGKKPTAKPGYQRKTPDFKSRKAEAQAAEAGW